MPRARRGHDAFFNTPDSPRPSPSVLGTALDPFPLTADARPSRRHRGPDNRGMPAPARSVRRWRSSRRCRCTRQPAARALPPSSRRRRRSSPLAATPPPTARRSKPVSSSASLGAHDQVLDDRGLVGGRQVGLALRDVGRRPARAACRAATSSGPRRRSRGCDRRRAWRRVPPASASRRSGTRNASGSPSAARRCSAGPPGKPRPSILAPLSNASPAASSSVRPSVWKPSCSCT